MTDNDIRLNLGCAGRPRSGYINIDLDDIEKLQARYPNQDFPKGIDVYQYDIFNLPYEDSTVSEVRCDSLLEHLSFLEEPKFFYEMKRVLTAGGLLHFSVPDFEETVKQWLAAKDEWMDFYRNDPEAIAQCHWFGQYSYSTDNRWGYLTASLFGPQNSPGQFHKNCYTVPKIKAILNKIGFEEEKISHYLWKEERNLMIDVKARKR